VRTTLDRFGRTVVPKQVRDALHLGPGAVFDVEATEDSIVLRPHREKVSVMQKEGLLVFMGDAATDLEGAVANQRTRRIRDLAGSW